MLNSSNSSMSAGGGGLDDTDIIRRVDTEEEENDVTVANVVNDSMSVDMASVSVLSMAGVSDASGIVIKEVSSAGSQSSGSSADVHVVRQGDVTAAVDMTNNSMAGLSDVSMSEVRRVNNGNDSVADYSMASLKKEDSSEDQILRMNDPETEEIFSSLAAASEGSGYILDGLRQELGMPSISNP